MSHREKRIDRTEILSNKRQHFNKRYKQSDYIQYIVYVTIHISESESELILFYPCSGSRYKQYFTVQF